ncbi:MAG: CHASE2 domain-containing protein [Hyphomicrobiaceae bacterium]
MPASPHDYAITTLARSWDAAWQIGPVLLRIAISLAIILLDPFGLGSNTAQYTQKVVTAVTAPFYPSTGQTRITAVIIDDDTAERLDEGYPIALATHALILRRVLCANPAAVFIDIAFRTPRGGLDGVEALVDALRWRVGPDGMCRPHAPAEMERPGVTKVFLAIQRSPTAACRSLLDIAQGNPACDRMRPLDRLLEVAIPVDITDLLEGDRYALATRSPTPGPSPALLLVDALCQRSPDVGAICGGQAKAEQPSELLLRWGLYPPQSAEAAILANQSQAGEQAITCPLASQATGWTGRLHDAVATVRDLSVQGFDNQGRPARRTPCPYHFYATGEAIVREDPARSTRLRAELENRAVIYGAAITGIADEINSPVHGLLPGLFAHAMATDNLLTMGVSHWRPPPDVSVPGLGAIEATAILEAMLSVFFVLATVALNQAFGRLSLIGTALTVTFYSAVGIAVAAILVLGLHWAPSNAVLLMALAATAALPETKPVLWRGHSADGL